MNKITTEASNRLVNPIKIAPIFKHGPGSGRIGCDMPNYAFTPPEYYNTIIFDTLKDKGIILDKMECPTISLNIIPHYLENNYCITPRFIIKQKIEELDHYLESGNKENINKLLRELSLSYNDSNYDLKQKLNGLIRKCINTLDYDLDHINNKKVELAFDGYNAEYNLGIIFVSLSKEDLLYPLRGDCSVMSFNTLNTAYQIRKQFVQMNSVNVGIFYDPAIMIDTNDNNHDRAKFNAESKSNQLLLAQVEDFIKWLNIEEDLENFYLRRLAWSFSSMK